MTGGGAASTSELASPRPGFVLAADAGSPVEVMGARYVFKARADETKGALCQFEGIVPPGTGSPLHRVLREDKTFFVIDGELEFVVGDATSRVTRGGFVVAPRGIPHRFTNVGGSIARLLVSFVPAGGHDRLFAELGALSRDASRAQVEKIAARDGVELI